MPFEKRTIWHLNECDRETEQVYNKCEKNSTEKRAPNRRRRQAEKKERRKLEPTAYKMPCENRLGSQIYVAPLEATEKTALSHRPAIHVYPFITEAHKA